MLLACCWHYIHKSPINMAISTLQCRCYSRLHLAFRALPSPAMPHEPVFVASKIAAYKVGTCPAVWLHCNHLPESNDWHLGTRVESQTLAAIYGCRGCSWRCCCCRCCRCRCHDESGLGVEFVVAVQLARAGCRTKWNYRTQRGTWETRQISHFCENVFFPKLFFDGLD